MEYAEVLTLKGDSRKFRLSPEIKKYSLRDLGFVESKTGKFQLERTLDFSDARKYKLKVVISPDLKKFKMVTLNANGLKEVNIFNGKNSSAFKEQLDYVLENLIEREIIVKV